MAPGLSASPGIASSLPVKNTATLSRRVTVNSARPTEAAKPQAISFRANMSVLDVMIDVGGLTRFAAGNRAVIVRKTDGKDIEQRVRLDDLIKDGDVSANVKMLPGDILIIPQSYF